MATRPMTTWDVVNGHVTLDLQRLDHFYLSGYVIPNAHPSAGRHPSQFDHHQGSDQPRLCRHRGDLWRGDRNGQRDLRARTPSWQQFNSSNLIDHQWVAVDGTDRVLGWVAVSLVAG